MSLSKILAQRDQLKDTLLSKFSKSILDNKIKNLLNNQFSLDEIIDIYHNKPDLLLNLNASLKDVLALKILSTVNSHEGIKYNSQLTEIFSSDLQSIKILFDLKNIKGIDYYIFNKLNSEKPTMKAYAEMIYMLCEHNENGYARDLIKSIFDKKIDNYTTNTELAVVRNSEETIRHQLLFAALRVVSPEEVAAKWSSLKTLTPYCNFGDLDNISTKSTLFWNLNINKKFKEFSEYLVDSPYFYLMVESVGESGKISNNFAAFVLRHMDFNAKDFNDKLLQRLSENQEMFDQSSIRLSKSDFYNIIHGNDSINRTNFMTFIDTYEKCYNDISDFSYDLSTYIKNYREKNNIIYEAKMKRDKETSELCKYKYLDDDFFTEIMESYSFSNSEEREKMISEWVRWTNNVTLIKPYLETDLKKFILGKKIPVHLSLFNENFDMHSLITSYRHVLGNKKDLSFLLDCNKMDSDPSLYIEEILKPLVDDALKNDVAFNKIFYKKISLVIESFEDMENKKEIIEKIDSLKLKDEYKIEAINKIVGENLYPTLEYLKSKIEKRILNNLLNVGNYEIKRKNRL